VEKNSLRRADRFRVQNSVKTSRMAKEIFVDEVECSEKGLSSVVCCASNASNARNIARRLLEDPNTPAEVKAKAQRLADLLDQRERLETQLIGKRQDFLRAHRQELDELRQLRERAEISRQNLRSSREKAIAENLPKIQEMRRLTEEARQTAQELRQQYRRGGQEESR